MSYVLHHADCLDVLRGMADKSVDSIISDPPFEAEAHTLQRRVKREGGVAVIEPLTFLPIDEKTRIACSKEFARVARRWVLVFCQVEAAMVWRDTCEDAGLTYRRTCVWIKPDGQPQLSGDRPGMGYESIVAMHRKGRSVWNGGGKTGVFTFNKNSGGKHDHPTQKPVPLMAELVELFTDPGETILDPFAGSGTTGVAALRLGRNFIGIEKDAAYHALARERLEAEVGGTTLQAARAGQTTLFGKGGK